LANLSFQGGDEEKFKLVVEAHAVLSDPQRRARYDMGEDEDGMNGGGPGGGFPGGFGPGGFGQNVDLTDLFGQFHSGGMAGSGFGARGFNTFGAGGGGGGSSRRGFHAHSSHSHSHSGGFPYFE
jgi:DnaJ family protein C protein 7